MKQNKLVKKLYRACLTHDQEKIQSIRKQEFSKILKHRAEGKPFGPHWCVVRI